MGLYYLTSTTAGITSADFCPEVDVSGSVNQMQQIVLSVVVVYHRACLCFDCDASFSFHIQLVQDLLLSSRLDGAREFKESVAESALAMIYMSNNAEVSEAVDGDLGDSFFEWSLDSGCCCTARGSAQGVTGAIEGALEGESRIARARATEESSNALSRQ